MPPDLLADPRLRQAHTLFESGRFAEAVPLYEPLIKDHPAHWGLRYSMGCCMLGLGQLDRAISEFKLAAAFNPKAPAPYIELAQAYSLKEQYPPALSALDRALALRPNWEPAVANKADLLNLVGRTDEAIELARAQHARGVTEPRAAALVAGVLAKAGQRDEAIALLERFVDEPKFPDAHKVSLYYALGRLLDKAGRYDDAWAAYARANDTVRKPFDAAQHSAFIDRMINAWTRPVLEALPKPTRTLDNLVFIVGMPRSGTSLTEQILASHPDVEAGGERDTIARVSAELLGIPDTSQTYVLADPTRLQDQATIDKAARSLINAIPPKARRATVFTDKMPGNWRHLALIQALAPNAKVIWCRRDPIDTCLSCYFQNFYGPHLWRNTLEHAALVHKDHDRNMRHWLEVIDLPILEVVYEETVADQEAQTRRLLDFLGLPWDDATLSFHETDRVVRTSSNEQVRQPMYTSSVKRWKNYEKHLGPLIQAFPEA